MNEDAIKALNVELDGTTGRLVNVRFTLKTYRESVSSLESEENELLKKKELIEKAILILRKHDEP